MPSGGGPGVGIGSASRALCKLSSMSPKMSGMSDKNCTIGPSTPVGVRRCKLVKEKVKDPRNQGTDPHPLGDHHPNHSILGRIVHDRTLSCQNSKLYIIHYIIPYIIVALSTFSFNTVITKKSISTFCFEINVK